jgi:ElaB/YqjD/DUF883 family membrane-anchored ribosome-binding protein
MESTFDNSGESIGTDGKPGNPPAGDAPGRGSGAGREIHDLTADVQDLWSRLGHVSDPGIARLRAKVGRSLVRAQRALAGGTDRVQRHAKNAMSAGDSYVRDNPLQAVGIAAAAGLVVGFFVARRYVR